MPYNFAMATNPAFTGNDTVGRLQIGYRNQWPKLSASYMTTYAGYSAYVSKLNAYAGLLYVNDVAGNITNNSVNLVYAQNVKLSKKILIRPAIQVGWFKRDIDVTGLTYGDMIDPCRGFVYSSSNVVLKSRQGIDLSAGLSCYAYGLTAGFSYHHINEPNESLIEGGNSKQPSKLAVQLGYTYHLNINSSLTCDFTPFFMYNQQASFSTYIAGANLLFNKHIILGGGWWKDDATFLTAGYKNKLLSVQYAYDFETKALNNSGGAHEITLGFNIWKQKANKLFLPAQTMF